MLQDVLEEMLESQSQAHNLTMGGGDKTGCAAATRAHGGEQRHPTESGAQRREVQKLKRTVSGRRTVQGQKQTLM